jgi:hypothetical protein
MELHYNEVQRMSAEEIINIISQSVRIRIELAT